VLERKPGDKSLFTKPNANTQQIDFVNSTAQQFVVTAAAAAVPNNMTTARW
jgi:hypothetical protein